MRTGCIYSITNLVNDKKYIGLTKNINKRFRAHKKNLKNNNHHNRHLQYAWDKYGKEIFSFELIESNIPIDKIEEKEIYYIKTFDSFHNGYNLTSGGEKSKTFSEETIKRMIKSGKEKIFSREHKKHISESLKGKNNGMYGREHTPETKKQISKANKGRKFSKKTIRKMSESHKGIERSEEFKKKLSEALQGREFSEEAIKKMSKAKMGKKNPMYGKEITEEHRNKLSKTNSGKNNGMYGKKIKGEHRRKISEKLSGVNHPNSKISKKQGKYIYNTYHETNKTLKELSNKFKVGISTISRICRGKHWTTKNLNKKS
jgi:group I intron endonuclease